jgi:hypothetical protein
MQKTFILPLVCTLGLSCLSGCMTAPATQQPQASAQYVGDRASVSFDEVVVSVSVADTKEAYQNLHVGLAAIINPRKETFYNPYQVESIVRRLEPRISAEVLKLVEGNRVSLQELGPLRARVGAKVQDVVGQTLARWTHASEYDVEVVVVSLYLTDSSVGRTARERRGWW